MFDFSDNRQQDLPWVSHYQRDSVYRCRLCLENNSARDISADMENYCISGAGVTFIISSKLVLPCDTFASPLTRMGRIPSL
jgi:hypothetical protein